jgi:hypothetical protein
MPVWRKRMPAHHALARQKEKEKSRKEKRLNDLMSDKYYIN